jgi:hypothetical protein
MKNAIKERDFNHYEISLTFVSTCDTQLESAWKLVYKVIIVGLE